MHEEWLLKAQNDLRSAVKLASDPEIILDTSIYHTQQAAEKAFKAFLVFKNQPIKRVHDLEYLLELCRCLDQRFSVLHDCAKFLHPFCSAFRYPDDILVPEQHEVEKAISCAKKIVAFVKKITYEKQDPTESIFNVDIK